MKHHPAPPPNGTPSPGRWTRREFLASSLAGTVLGLAGYWTWKHLLPETFSWKDPFNLRQRHATTFVARASNYGVNLVERLLSGLKELRVSPEEIKGKRVLLKPNLVETRPGTDFVNTHPLVVRAAVEAFLHLGASQVLVAEGVGHCRDSLRILEESGLAQVLAEDRIRFVDLNYDEVYTIPNAHGYSRLTSLTLPATLRQVDWIVSLAKMKTHHWAGVTLAMKNLFGIMPGSYYGWPKNVLHYAGIPESILDINAALAPQLAIVDGIMGMEGDGPIMGVPKHAGVLVMGRNLPAVDATCARIMGIDPQKIDYLAAASGRLGLIQEKNIQQRGERIAAVRTDFALLDKIPAQRSLRLL